ncbi:MAG: hypothetical protein K2X08_02290 [Chlamydiales bacterium]|nr:hypothetical protein [Chlamydiales bacterium]MBY0530049.1 hypothetical protein [Rhabdochlamydiaceae bacterium]
MSTDVKDTNLIDTKASELLVKLLNGDVEWLSEQDKFVLTENRKAILQHLNAIFSKEIPRLLRRETGTNKTHQSELIFPLFGKLHYNKRVFPTFDFTIYAIHQLPI